MLPLYHDFTDETVLVIGGGSVGARRARRFAHEADVVVVSAAFPADEYGASERVRAVVDPDDVGAWIDRTSPVLVVAATDDASVNDAAERVSRDRKLLFNRVDGKGGGGVGRVVVPAIARDGDVVVSVSTNGRSPALAGALRRRIEACLDGVGKLATHLDSARRELRRRDVPPAVRREALRTAAHSERVWADIDTENEKTRRKITSVIDAVLEEHT